MWGKGERAVNSLYVDLYMGQSYGLELSTYRYETFNIAAPNLQSYIQQLRGGVRPLTPPSPAAWDGFSDVLGDCWVGGGGGVVVVVVKDMVDKTWRVVPLKMVPVCVAKYDLCLREAAPLPRL